MCVLQQNSSGRNDWSQAGTEDTQDEAEASCNAKSNEMLKNKDVACHMDTGANLKEHPMAKTRRLSNKVNNIVLSYNPEYKIILMNPCWYK
jgi:hypothetical protein